jgi:feruloyl esterase
LLVAGCGGLCGSVEMGRTADALARGSAVATTDMGHPGATIAWTTDPARVKDWSYRSTHVTTLLAKSVVKAFYHRAQSHAYFRGCSTGGRQALTEALIYPADFDGIIAGAPAGGLAISSTIWQARANLTADGTQNILDAGALVTLHRGVLAACDAADGLSDGIISNPAGCAFDPARLQCRPGQSQGCWSAAQVEAARKIYDGIRTSNGRTITPVGSARGSELDLIPIFVRSNGQPSAGELTAENAMRAAGAPSAKLADFNFDTDPLKASDVSNMPLLGPDGGNLAAFRDRGAKLVLYSGWADPLISPAVATGFYQKQVAELGGAAAIDSFLRLFMIPGMSHCGGGDGPEAVDWLSAVEGWVEKGVAPASVVAIKPVKRLSSPNEYRFPIPSDNVAFARPVFPYPAYTRYSGSGDPKAAASFVAATADR